MDCVEDERILFGTTKHIINEGTIQVFTTRANEIKKGLVILYIVFFVDQFLFLDGIVTERTEYHPPPHHCHSLSF
jgi:hypothetical protein